MIDVTTFGAGLGLIALKLARAVEPSTIRAYHDDLRDRTDPAEWTEFCKVAALRFGWEFFPSTRQLSDALDEFRGKPSLSVEADEAHDRVVDCRSYSPETGATWSYRQIEAQCGRAAAEAFIAAGGHSAFETTYREDQRRARFVEAYTRAARAMPDQRLLPVATPVKSR